MRNSSDPPDAASRVQIFEIGTDRHLHSIANDEPCADWLRDGTVRWIAARNYDRAELEALCQSCGIELPEQILEVIRKPVARPTVVRLENLLLVSYSIGFDENTWPVLALCARSTILTFHQAGELMREVIRDCREERRLRTRAPLAILFELIEAALKRLTTRAFRLRMTLVNLTDKLEAGTRKLESGEHLALKQEATELEIRLEDHLYCLTELAKYESETVDSSSVRPFIQQLQGDIARGLEAIGRLKSRIGDLHQFQVRQSDETTNRRLKIITVLSAIYLPPTLIAGIYGMNFEEIPIASTPHGYGFVLLIMVAIVVGQLVFFYKRGWFK